MNVLDKIALKLMEKEATTMLNNFLAHPKTSIAGILIAVLGVLANGRSWQSIGLAALTAILGALAKDPNAPSIPNKPYSGGSSLKLLAFAFALLLAFAVPLHAQNAPLATTNITANFTAVSLPGGSQSFVGTLDDIGVSFTPNTNIGFETVQAPSSPNYSGYYGGTFSYQFNGISKWINDISPNLSGYKFRFTAIASGGIARLGSSNHVAGDARFRSEYALSGSGSYSLLAEVGAARLYTAGGWKPMIALGGIFHF